MAKESYCKRASAVTWIVVGLVVMLVALAVVVGVIVQSEEWKYPRELQQRAQFHSIIVAIDMFVIGSRYDNFPPSNNNSLPPAHSEDPTPYGGAQKLAEALVGWDLSGYHP